MESVILCGATGKTGNAIAHGFAARDDVRLAACVAPSVATKPSRSLPADVLAFATLGEAIDQLGAVSTVVLDVTQAQSALEHIAVAFDSKIPIVVGSTGISTDQLTGWGEQYSAQGLGLFEVPNFSIGAVLMMQVAQQLASSFETVEIVETHHATKRDAPSGTARRTAAMVSRARESMGNAAEVSGSDEGSRGQSIDGVAVHALRIAGATAHQSVVFGSVGEMLTVTHDAIDRSCYVEGAARAVLTVRQMNGLHTGLEHAL